MIERQVLTILSILCLLIVNISVLVLALAALNISIGIRRRYIRFLAFIFNYATNIKRKRDIVIDRDAPANDEPSTLFHLRDENTAPVAASIIEKSSCDPIEIAPNTSLHPQTPTPNYESSSDELRQWNSTTKSDSEHKTTTSSSHTDIQFRLGYIIDYTRQGLEAIVDDEVTKRFSSAKEMTVWNLLTRTQQQDELVSWRVILLWVLGLIIRYGILFPFRVCLFCLVISWMMCSTLVLKYFPSSDAKFHYGFYVNRTMHRILLRALSASITFHNIEHRATRGSICVANHTSPMDAIILATDNAFVIVGQSSHGFTGFVQRTLSHTADHIWFERSEARDRHIVAEKMREHIRDKRNLPILIFPEGIRTNNTSVMIFKKGCFEISEALIYPVAIKYDNRFGDAFWNSPKHKLFEYLILMMTSWAIVVDVYYLPPMHIGENESPINFARRAKAAIAKRGGFVDLDWDGCVKRTLPKPSLRVKEQQKFVEMLKAK